MRPQVCGRVLPNLAMESFGEVQPFEEEEDGDGDAPGPAAVRSCDTVTLQRGQTLYLPAGVVHRARATKGDASLHLTVGVARTHHKFAWAGMLDVLLEEAAARRDDKFRTWIQHVAAAPESNGVLGE
jgi:hypothetical protein